jgi:RNA recognition motif-containing protein
LYVGNLSFYTTLEELREIFEDYGEVVDCYMPEDRETGRSRGFAFVQMEPGAAQQAAEECDGFELDGRVLRVNEAQPKGYSNRQNDENEGSWDEGSTDAAAADVGDADGGSWDSNDGY